MWAWRGHLDAATSFWLLLSYETICSASSKRPDSSLHQGRRAVWKHALVRSEVRQPAKRPPATPQSTSQVNPGGTADNSERHANERLRVHACSGGPRRHSRTVCIKVSMRVWRLQGERALHLPYTWRTGSQSVHDRVPSRQESRDNVRARPRGGAIGQDHYTGRPRHGQVSHWAMGQKNGRLGRMWHLDEVDRQITNEWWKSRSRGGALERRQLDGLPQLPRHGKNGAIQHCTMGDQIRIPKVHCNRAGIPGRQIQDSGSVQCLSGGHQTDSAPGPVARAADSQSNQRAC